MALAFASGGSGGGGTVKSVSAGDTSIVVGGTATDPTVETADLSTIAADHATTANIALNSHKITGLANGAAPSDAATVGQVGVTSLSAADTSLVVSGTAAAPTVRTATLDVIAADHPAAADWSNNSHKITSLANGTAAQDAAAFGQIPTALPPSGAAGGDLTGTYPNPTIGAGKVTLADLAAAVTPGLTQLVYRYTVAGSDKASIDTGVDAPDAGSNDWANGDLLEVFMVLRTSDAAASANVLITVNNDAGANYDGQNVRATSTTVAGSAILAANNWARATHGSGGTGSYGGVIGLTIPNYAGTTFFKTGHLAVNETDGTALNNQVLEDSIGYRSTSAITRLKVIPASGLNLKVGSQLLIYKRLAS